MAQGLGKGALGASAFRETTPWARSMPRGRAILPAVVQTVREFQIPPESLLAVLDGVEMDLEPRVYATFDELAVYCERVASAVGLACIHIWGFLGGEQRPRAPSRSAGLALQLTNILRDLSEDARRGRVYLPLEDLRACGYSAEELQNGVVNRPFLRLMEMEIDRAEQFYREAAELSRSLHKDGRRIFGLMMETYHALLRRHSPPPGRRFHPPHSRKPSAQALAGRTVELAAGGTQEMKSEIRMPKSATRKRLVGRRGRKNGHEVVGQKGLKKATPAKSG